MPIYLQLLRTQSQTRLRCLEHGILRLLASIMSFFIPLATMMENPTNSSKHLRVMKMMWAASRTTTSRTWPMLFQKSQKSIMNILLVDVLAHHSDLRLILLLALFESISGLLGDPNDGIEIGIYCGEKDRLRIVKDDDPHPNGLRTKDG